MTQTYVNPYDNPAHIKWVEDGGCPAIHRIKAWCNGHVNHSGDHDAPYRDAQGRITSHLRWKDKDNHPKS